MHEVELPPSSLNASNVPSSLKREDVVVLEDSHELDELVLVLLYRPPTTEESDHANCHPLAIWASKELDPVRIKPVRC